MKKVIVIFLMLAVCLTLTGCGRQGDRKDTTLELGKAQRTNRGLAADTVRGQAITTDDLSANVDRLRSVYGNDNNHNGDNTIVEDTCGDISIGDRCKPDDSGVYKIQNADITICVDSCNIVRGDCVMDTGRAAGLEETPEIIPPEESRINIRTWLKVLLVFVLLENAILFFVWRNNKKIVAKFLIRLDELVKAADLNGDGKVDAKEMWQLVVKYFQSKFSWLNK